ncbi:MAG: hypothetical protein H3C34_18490 [Caldilineaceae bacterium]|nr:hypothetical protein [Caldilineaceae bacterium]
MSPQHPYRFHIPAVAKTITVLAVFALVLAAAGAGPLLAQDEVPELEGETIAIFDAPDARQGVAVDDGYFYAVDNYHITKHDKETGEALLQWDGVTGDGPIIHLDSGVVVDGKLYAAHSNYPVWPMTSSVEVWDTETMEHIDTYSFGIQVGSFTWLDRYDGYWWGAFANYNRVQDGPAYCLWSHGQYAGGEDGRQLHHSRTVDISGGNVGPV